MIVFEDGVVFFFTLLHVDESVSGSRHEYGRCTMVNWVERNLEVAEVALYVTLTTDARLSNELFTFPVPHEALPVWLSRQSHDIAFILRIKRTCDELLRVKSIHVLNLLRQCLLPFLTCDVVDREFSLVADWTPLTDSYVLLTLRH